MTGALIAIVYHSGYGHTERQAVAVRDGADRVEGSRSLLLDCVEATDRLADLAAADAIIFGAPTYMGSASGQFKAFMDASSKAYFAGEWKDKIAAGFTCSASRSGDKLNTLIQFVIFAAQHGMHWVSLGLEPGNNSSSGTEDDLNRLGFFLGAGAQANADEAADMAPPPSDLRTAALLGERVALATLQFVRGRDRA